MARASSGRAIRTGLRGRPHPRSGEASRDRSRLAFHLRARTRRLTAPAHLEHSHAPAVMPVPSASPDEQLRAALPTVPDTYRRRAGHFPGVEERGGRQSVGAGAPLLSGRAPFLPRVTSVAGPPEQHRGGDQIGARSGRDGPGEAAPLGGKVPLSPAAREKRRGGAVAMAGSCRAERPLAAARSVSRRSARRGEAMFLGARGQRTAPIAKRRPLRAPARLWRDCRRKRPTRPRVALRMAARAGEARPRLRRPSRSIRDVLAGCRGAGRPRKREIGHAAATARVPARALRRAVQFTPRLRAYRHRPCNASQVKARNPVRRPLDAHGVPLSPRSSRRKKASACRPVAHRSARRRGASAMSSLASARQTLRGFRDPPLPCASPRGRKR